MMGVWVPETCWADYNCNKTFSSIKLVFFPTLTGVHVSVGTCCHYIQGTDRDSRFLLNVDTHRSSGRKFWPWLSMGLSHISWVKFWRERTEIFSNTDVCGVFLWLLVVRCSACNKSIESDMWTALPFGIHGWKFRLSQKNLPAFRGHNCPSVHYVRNWNTPVMVFVVHVVTVPEWDLTSSVTFCHFCLDSH